jgi:hypothetical protein
MNDELLIKTINEGQKIPKLSLDQWSRINFKSSRGSAPEKMAIEKIAEFSRQNQIRTCQSKNNKSRN